MRSTPVFKAIGAAALVAAATLAAVSSTQDASRAATPVFDPLFACGASCTPARAGGDVPALAAAQQRFDTTWLGERGGPSLARL